LPYYYRTTATLGTEVNTSLTKIPYILKGNSLRLRSVLAGESNSVIQFVKIRTKLLAVSDLLSPQKKHNVLGSNRLPSFEREPGVTAIRVEDQMALVSVRFPDTIPESRLRLLELLAQARVPINQVKLLPEGLCFVISENYATACRKLLDSEKGEITLLENMALISTIAGAMRDLSGVIARICEALLGALSRALKRCASGHCCTQR
jgi:aspartokinase